MIFKLLDAMRIGTLNNYNIKMDSNLLKELADFTELRRKTEDFNTNNSKQSAYIPNIDLDL